MKGTEKLNNEMVRGKVNVLFGNWTGVNHTIAVGQPNTVPFTVFA